MTLTAQRPEVAIDLTEAQGAVHGPATASEERGQPARRRWAKPRAALVVGGLALAAWLLVPQLRELPAAVAALEGASPMWLAVAAASTMSAYAAAALALQASIGTRLPLGRNLQVQVASAAASAMTPAGAGGLALHTSFLQGRGVPRAQALAAVGVGRLAAAGVHVTSLLILAPGLARRTGAVDLPAALPVSVAAVAVLSVVLLRHCSPRLRLQSDRLLAPLGAALRTVAADPQRIAGLLGGSFLVSAFRALTFAAALKALGVAVPLVAVAALFLAAEAIGALGSTPGGMGLLDGALLTGIVALGAPSAAGLGAVLLFRLMTLWVPVVPGLVTLRTCGACTRCETPRGRGRPWASRAALRHVSTCSLTVELSAG